jgi:hypothetical protein
MTMQKRKVDPLDIPAFLKVANREKIKIKLPAVKKKEVTSDPLEQLGVGQETIELLRTEIKSGRFQPRWLHDPITVFVFERLHQLRKERFERKKEEQEVERKINRVVKPEFGTSIRIIVLNRDPKRQPGAARIPRFASLLAYLDKNPNASVAEIFKNTQYIKSDFSRDQRLKIIKTDLITKPVAAKKEK